MTLAEPWVDDEAEEVERECETVHADLMGQLVFAGDEALACNTNFLSVVLARLPNSIAYSALR